MPAPSRSSFSPGIARGLAAAVGIPAELAISGGEPAACAMMALKQARDAGGGGLRAQHLVQAQHHISGLDPARHGPLMQHLQACALAMGGRGGDTHIAHVTPGEVVVPESLLTPDVVAILRRAAKEKGIDPSRFVVGSGRNVINPNTGQMEFDDQQTGSNDTTAPEAPNTLYPGRAPVNPSPTQDGQTFNPFQNFANPGILDMPTDDQFNQMPNDVLTGRKGLLDTIDNVKGFADIGIPTAAFFGTPPPVDLLGSLAYGGASLKFQNHLSDLKQRYSNECGARNIKC